MTDTEEPDDIGYADAMTELEDILERLEGDDLDVDALAIHVERASTLIDVCRSRITKARLQVESVVTKLEDSGEPGPDGPSGPEGDHLAVDDELRLLDDS